MTSIRTTSRRGFNKLAISGIFTASLGALTAGRAWADRPVKLGFNGDLSASPSAQSGRAAVVGIQAAIDDLKTQGTGLGYDFTLVVRDDLRSRRSRFKTCPI